MSENIEEELKQLKKQLSVYSSAFKQYKNIDEKYNRTLEALKETKKELLQTNEMLETKVRQRTQELEEKQHYLQSVIDGINEPVVVINTDYTVSMMNIAISQTLPSAKMADPSRPKCYEVIQHRMIPCDEGGGELIECPLRKMLTTRSAETTVYSKISDVQGAKKFEALSSPLWNEEGLMIGIIQTHRDITEHVRLRSDLERQKDALDYQAHYDVLTSLPNRLYFNEHLMHSIKKSNRYNRKIALLFIDLDKFKQINDTMGHNYGDLVLQHVAGKIIGVLRSEDLLFRIGGDEFTVIMENIRDVEEAIRLAGRINAVLQEPMLIREKQIYMTSSVGISLYPDDAMEVNDLIRFADAAMYKAKEEGRNTFRVYSTSLSERISEKFDLELKLRDAIANREFTVYYQPQIDAITKKLIGMEALVRWISPSQGIIVPQSFISLAEETGLIVMIDDFVMKTAILQFCEWKRQRLDPGVLALNISVKKLEEECFLTDLQKYMQQCGMRPEWLELEITESDIMKKPEDNIFKLNQLRDMGVKVAIDDFGTGYSSLSYLKKLPISKLKIDQSFIHELPNNEEDAQITKAIVAMSRSLNLQTIAEGVETKEQEAFLIESTCDDLQGFLYSKPIDKDEMYSYLLKAKENS